MARAIKLIDAPIGLFEVDGILVLKTEYSTRHEDGTITPDCYIIESGEYFWGGVDSVEERNNLEVAPVDMPTLTPPNEWVEALEAINNAAVAYIEGGPYENDLPGMELAVEIDRLSRDFVRPPNEPLTIEQLREMDGEPVWVEEVEHWALIDVEKGGQWDGVPFAVWAENGTKFTYNIMNRNLHCYRRPPEGEENA